MRSHPEAADAFAIDIAVVVDPGADLPQSVRP